MYYFHAKAVVMGGEGGGGGGKFIHSRSRMTIDPGTRTMSARSTLGFTGGGGA